MDIEQTQKNATRIILLGGLPSIYASSATQVAMSKERRPFSSAENRVAQD